MLSTGYSTTGSTVTPSGTGASVDARPNGYWDVGRLKRCYMDYLGSKQEEIEEQKDARRYYHGAQWTSEQIKELRRRNSPVLTKNRINRKLNAIVGVIERLRQDPKAYPRTPQHEQGAELATAVLRYVLDQQDWNAKSPECALDGAVDGLAGIELTLEGGDQGDKEIGLEIVEPDSFFYDPRSFKMDFSDARYMGVGKWVDEDTLAGLAPNAKDILDQAFDSGQDLSSNPDREQKWFSTEGGNRRVRLVDIWYKHGGKWCWAIFTGSMIVMEGESYLTDEKGKTDCKFIMYSAAVDHDGDRYGFVRNMRPTQDGLNAKTSKLQHIMASRRLILRKGAVDNVERARKEWAKPDGVVVVNGDIGEEIKPDDQSADFAGWAKLLELDLAEMEGFGPNPQLMGQGGEQQSGRAIALMQQAGIAELGPYMLAYRGWKIRVYRAIWNAVQKHWTGERWIRVTDQEDVAQFIQLNGVAVDPNTGMPTLVNALGALDVDIILDEGPDQVNMMADTYDTLTALAQKGASVPPQVLLEVSPLPGSTKKRIKDIIDEASKQPSPEMQKVEAEMQGKAADLQIKQQATQLDAQTKREMAMLDAQLEREKTEARMILDREQMMHKVALQRDEMIARMQIEALKPAPQPAEAA